MARQLMFDMGSIWIPCRDGDGTCRHIFDGHYSRRHYADGRRPKLFVGPGEKLVLRSADAMALFVWRKFIDKAIPHQDGVNCAVFRNEGASLSSDLIRAAVDLAWERWPGSRLYTYVNPSRIRSSNPGFCFLAAGWRRAGLTRGGLHILERLPCWGLLEGYMPWTEKPEGEGFYYATYLGDEIPDVVSVFRRLKGLPLQAWCFADEDWKPLGDFNPRWLRIPSPEVLEAMEEFAAAVREDIGLNPARGMSHRVELALRDLIRAEGIGGKP